MYYIYTIQLKGYKLNSNNLQYIELFERSIYIDLKFMRII